MTTTHTPELLGVGHWVDISIAARRTNVKEDLRFEFLTEWRGEPAVIRLAAARAIREDRDGGFGSDWQMWGHESYLGTPDGNERRDTTPTAQARMSEAVQPLAREWLASDAYASSESAAYAWGIKEIARQLRNTDDSRDVRRALDAFKHKLTDEYITKLTALCDTWDAWATTYENTRFPQ